MPTANLSVEHSTEPWGVLLTLRGNAGVANTAVLDRHVLPIVASKPALVIVDLTGLEFVSSLGIGSIMAVHQGLRPKGKVRLVGPNPNVRGVLERTRVDALLEIFDTLEEAKPAPAS